MRKKRKTCHLLSDTETKGPCEDHNEFWLDDKIEAQIIHWNTQGHAFWAKLDLTPAVWYIAAVPFIQPWCLWMDWKETGNLVFHSILLLSTHFFPLLVWTPRFGIQRPFQIPHQTASLDVDQVPSMQEAVIEEQLTVNLEFCHCPFSATN